MLPGVNRDTEELPSGVYDVPPPPCTNEEMEGVEDTFIEAWSRLAGAFAMDPTMGRVHALIYVSHAAVGVDTISERFGLPADIVQTHVDTLVDWQLIYPSGEGYVAEQDPWTWFARTIRARQRREILPIRDAIESVRDAARALAKRSNAPGAERVRVVVTRIERFSAFVSDIAKLVDAFVTLGAAPMLKFASMTTRFVPRRVG